MAYTKRPTLTPDQYELLLACWRLDTAEDKAVAHALGIPHQACRARIRRLKEKLGVQSRSGLVSRAIKLGLIPGVYSAEYRVQTGAFASLATPANLLYSAGTFGATTVLMKPERREGRRMGTVRYTVGLGEVLSENRNGVKRDYVPDPLGSTVALLDAAQAKNDTWTYWPYGEVVARTGTTATPYQFVGTRGYYSDTDGRKYVRARYLDTVRGRWFTQDPIGFVAWDPNRYRYVGNAPTSLVDPSGMRKITQCGRDIAIPPATVEPCSSDDDCFHNAQRDCALLQLTYPSGWTCKVAWCCRICSNPRCNHFYCRSECSCSPPHPTPVPGSQPASVPLTGTTA